MLIDGDGMIFDNKLISKGEAGGKEAAGLLWKFVTEYAHQHMTNLPSDYKIVTRVYANLAGLGDICQRSGIVDRADMIENFARGLTGSKQLFDFVDVGVGKDRADDKISGNLPPASWRIWLIMRRNIQITSLRLSLSTYSFWLLSR